MSDKTDNVEILVHTGMLDEFADMVTYSAGHPCLPPGRVSGLGQKPVAIDRFISYSIESDLFTADDAFTITMASPGFRILAGMRIDVKVNGLLEMTGIVDRVENRVAKREGKITTISGRDLMGLLVDSHVETFPTEQDVELKALAATLLKNVPYINTKNIVYGSGDANRAADLAERREDFEFVQIEPGKTIFETLKEYATARGMLFWCRPDGTLVFDLPKTSGKPDCYLLYKENISSINNIIEGSETRDISKAYSKITIIGQKQGTDFLGAEQINTQASVNNLDFRFRTLHKPFVGETEYDGQNPEKYARLLMEKQNFEGLIIEYKVAGHSQNGRNYSANSVASVDDDQLEIKGSYLIYARTFEMDRDLGITTTLKLSELGVLPP